MAKVCYRRRGKRVCRRKSASRHLGGAMRTCRKYVCVRGHGTSKGSCRSGFVLRCGKYAGKPGLAPAAGQRKGYAQYIYGGHLPGGAKTVRSKFPPSKYHADYALKRLNRQRTD
jgi:hypothetical protein